LPIVIKLHFVATGSLIQSNGSQLMYQGFGIPCQLSPSQDRTVRIRHQCRKTFISSCHRCLVNTGVEKWTTFKYRLWPLLPGSNVIKLFLSVNYGFS
jgi:hypothetical protein